MPYPAFPNIQELRPAAVPCLSLGTSYFESVSFRAFCQTWESTLALDIDMTGRVLYTPEAGQWLGWIQEESYFSWRKRPRKPHTADATAQQQTPAKMRPTPHLGKVKCTSTELPSHITGGCSAISAFQCTQAK